LNISYFLNADASNTNNPSQTFLAGDRNLQSNGQAAKPGLLVMTTNTDLNWSSGLHPHGGNLAFIDGHVGWSKTNELNSLIQQQSLATNHIIVP
jgi:prepilin-type processing-associated H-X9-DG protein